MSKLRDLINSQKGKANEQVVSSQTVQSETKPEIKTSEAPISQGKLSVLDRLKSKTISEPQNGITVQSSVVDQRQLEHVIEPGTTLPGNSARAEETMPSGLSLMQQIKWKREHVSVQTNDKVHSAKIEPTAAGIKVDGTSNSGNAVTSEQTNDSSASQTADAQKTNDGVANIEELKKNLAYLANNIENPALVGQVVRTIAQQIANSPELTPHMSRGEVNLMVRGLRMSYQVAAMKKQEKVDAKVAKSKGSAELGQMFKDAGLDFAGLNLNLK